MGRNNRRGKPKGGNKQAKFNLHFYDRGRPNAPYVTGSSWTLVEHVPPPPYGEGYKLQHRRGPAALAKMRSEQLPQSKYVLQNPPPGPEPAADAPRLTIEIVEQMRVHMGRGAQVIACRVVDGATLPGAAAGSIIVAKIYDPLYYYYNGDYDIIESADMEYCREAAAYDHLKREGVDGQLLPPYFGSFTMDVPLTEEQLEIQEGCDNVHPHQTTRRVRLTLMGKVEGEAMTFQLVFGDVRKLPDEIRLQAVGTAMEAYAQLYHHGVVQGDLAPRNVFLREDGRMGHYRRLVFHRFVDLGLAYVLGNGNLGSTCPRQPVREERPRSPIRLFWNVLDSGVTSMFYWLPDQYCNTHDFQAWMLGRWYGDPRFEPIGPEPQPAADKTPWETGKAAKVLSWPADADKAADDNGGEGSAGPRGPVKTTGNTTNTGKMVPAKVSGVVNTGQQVHSTATNTTGGNGNGNGYDVYAAMEVKGFW